MTDLKFIVNLDGIKELEGDLDRFDAELKRAAQLLAGQAHAHIVEEVQTKLHSRRPKYIEALAKPVEVAEGVWVITLDAKASWIEEGMEPHDMVDDLLRKSPNGNAKSGPKQAKDGSTFRVIPFEHKKGPTQQTVAEQTLTASLKSQLRQLKIPWAKIERNQDGSPKSGMIHDLSKEINTPNRPGHAVTTPNVAGGNNPPNQHGFGHGGIGQPMQGKSGLGFLKGIKIYQRPLFHQDGSPQLDSHGQQKAVKSIVTFRIVSSKHKGKLWQHPGLEGCKFFDEAYRWLQTEWETRMMPEVLAKLGVS